tara:strand:- start:391 stop:1104 length:714 start_codon:yes stop_codon:yes gene_type:complete
MRYIDVLCRKGDEFGLKDLKDGYRHKMLRSVGEISEYIELELCLRTSTDVGLLLELCEGVEVDGMVLETGTYYGAASIAMAMYSKMMGLGRVITIERDMGEVGDLCLEGFDLGLGEGFGLHLPSSYGVRRWCNLIYNCVRSNIDGWLIPIGCDSLLALDFLSPVLRMLYVDGGHSYEVAKGDILGYGDMLVSGGLIVVDDYNEGHMGVMRAVDEVMFGGEMFTSCEVVGSMVKGVKA